ncbi:MAG: NAD(P)H-hydrate dehydratase [Actinomycetota bacterium]
MPTARADTPPPLPGARPLFDAAAVRDADARAAKRFAMPSLLLMERAGLAAADAVLARFPAAGRAVVVVGKGNNGGDGMVVARHLAEAGWQVEVVAPAGARPGTPDAMAMATIAARLGIRPRALDARRLAAEEGVVVDALLGTGARGEPAGPVAAAIRAIRSAPGPVVSLDVPSGLDADTGRAPGVCVRADLTVAFHGAKVGLHVEPGRSLAGEVVVADIGIPTAVASTPAAWLVDGAAAAAVPAKSAAGEKYGAGAVLVVCGSPGLVGAGVLASRATLRAGAGLTVAAVPAGVRAEVAGHLVEVMTAGIPEEDGAFGAASVDAVLAEAGRTAAAAVGPGLGRRPGTTAFLRDLLPRLGLPVVVDADGLWHLGEAAGWIGARRGHTVLTPHAGEAARLLGASRADVEAGRLDAARALAERSGAVVVLKGPGTIVAAPGGPVAVNATGGPALSTAGSGDVLTGVVAAFLAKGMDPFPAAAAAVAVHGRAAELTGRGDGTVAGDVADALPGALRPS